LSRVILLPCADRSARDNYNKTVVQPVDLSSALAASASRSELGGVTAKPTCRFWGVRERSGRSSIASGQTGPPTKPHHWESVAPGDVIVFTADKRLFAVGRVLHTLVDADLAEYLWGQAADGRPFKYIMALEETYSIDRPAVDLLTAIGEGTKKYVQDFRVLDEISSEKALSFLSVQPDHFEFDDPDPVWGDGPTDAQTFSNRRREQRKLAMTVKSAAAGRCALCLRDFDDFFLVAAHIKQRSKCTEGERRDLGHVAMAACRLGCDPLFELGLITVTETGVLEPSLLLEESPALNEYFQQHLSGNRCARWGPRSEFYFAWHRSNVFRTPVTVI
jgi:hypothetical protein